MLKGISHWYKLDQSISVLRVVGWYFHIYSNFNRTFCKQTVETLIRRRVLRRLIWVCTVCLCPTQWTLGLYGSIATLTVAFSTRMTSRSYFFVCSTQLRIKFILLMDDKKPKVGILTLFFYNSRIKTPS